jgi:hypothetical protein
MGASAALAADPGRAPSTAAQSASAKRYGDLPLSFEPNQGQIADHAREKSNAQFANQQVRFVSRGSGYSLFLTQSGAVLAFSRDAHSDSVLQMQLAGSDSAAHIEGLDQLPGTSNYFSGNDSTRWHTGIPTYSRVKYNNIYPGISLVYYGNQRQLEYDFVVAPGADPRQIRLAISGAQKLSVDASVNLVLHNAAGEVQFLAPNVYQQIAGQKKEISGRWTLSANHTAGFRIGDYDRAQPLVIDPVLIYSSFLGGSQKNVLNKIVVDAAGNAYVAGYTTSGDFPAAPTPLVTTFGGGAQSRGAFVAKIDPTGSNLLYTTFLTGSGDDEATSLAVDKSGNVYLAGNTHSTDFPTRNALQPTCATHASSGCSSAFLTKISQTGDSLLFSTYLGGSGGESARGLVVEASGSAYLAGVTSSLDFPATSGAAQTKCGGVCQQNAFIAKFSPSGAKLAYATYIGGSAVDDTADLALDSSGNAYLVGHTTSPDFPLAAPYQKSCTIDATSSSKACVATAFVTKLKADGSSLVYSTYLGGSLGSQATAIAVDALGSAYVTGSTPSPDFPVLNPFQKSCGLDSASGKCSLDAFLTKFAPSGKTLVYSTYFGGSGHDEATGIAVDAAGNANIIGTTESSDFPTVKPEQPELKGDSDAFAVRFNPAGSALTFSTYHGGTATESGNSIALDAQGNVYLAGETTSPDFPTEHPFQSSCAGSCTSAFISKMAPPPVTVNPAPALTIVKAHTGTFTQGSTGTWTIVVNNTAPDSTTIAGLQVIDALPTGYTLATSTGANWTCVGTNALTCTSASTIAGGESYPTLTLNVNIPSTSPTTVNNTAIVSGGGALASASGSDNNVPVAQVPASLVAASGAGQSTPVGNNFLSGFSATVTDAANVPIQGVPVTFAAMSGPGNGTCFFARNSTLTVNSDLNGVAPTVTPCKANAVPVGYNVQASVTIAGVPTPNFAVNNTDFSPAFAPASADVAPGAAPAGVAIIASPINGYTPTSLTATSCMVIAGPTPVPTCSITSPITVGTPATVNFSTTGGAPAAYTVQATIHDSSPIPVTHTATLTLHIVQVTITSVPPSTIEVGQTAPFAASTAGLANTNVNWSTVGTGCFGVTCGSFNAAGPNAGTNYLAPPTTAPGLTVAIQASSAGDGTFTAVTGSIPITDYAVSLPGTTVIIPQTNPAATGASTLFANTVNPYAGIIATTVCSVLPTTGSLGPAPTCSVSTPAIPGSSAMAISTQANTPTGLYRMSVLATDNATAPVQHSTSPQALIVDCSFSLGSAGSFLPILNPATTTNNVTTPNSYSFGVTETAGGSNCAWGSSPVIGATIPASSTDGLVVLTTDTPGSIITSVNGFTQVTVDVTAPSIAAQSGSVTIPYFAPVNPGNTASLVLPVGLEAVIPINAVQAGNIAQFSLPVTIAAFGTLNVPNINLLGVTSVCSAVNSSGSDPNRLNFGITCTAAVSGNSVNLSVTLPADRTASATHDLHSSMMLLALGIGFPAIVFLSVGASAFASKNKKPGWNRLTCILGILLLLSLFVVAQACGGGSKAAIIPPNKYTLTLLGYATDSSNTVVGLDVFTILLTAN